MAHPRRHLTADASEISLARVATALALLAKEISPLSRLLFDK
jgi:hypothetical protein